MQHYLWKRFSRFTPGSKVVYYERDELDDYHAYFDRYESEVNQTEAKIHSVLNQSITEALFKVPELIASYDKGKSFLV